MIGEGYKLGIGFLLILLSWPVAFTVGSFTNNLNQNVCYSEVIDMVRLIGKENGAQSALQALNKLPISGYETNCDNVKETAARLNNGI